MQSLFNVNNKPSTRQPTKLTLVFQTKNLVVFGPPDLADLGLSNKKFGGIGPPDNHLKCAWNENIFPAVRQIKKIG